MNYTRTVSLYGSLVPAYECLHSSLIATPLIAKKVALLRLSGAWEWHAADQLHSLPPKMFSTLISIDALML